MVRNIIVNMLRSNSLKILLDSLSVAREISKHNGMYRGVWYFISVRTRGFGRLLFDCYSTAYSRLSGRPLIHVIGDSHAKVFRRHRLFIVHHLGAATAHNLAKENSTTNSNRKLFDILNRINHKDIVLMVFGEIDCRIHIYYQYKKNGEIKTVHEIIDETVSHYGSVLGRLQSLGINFVVQGVPPATRVRNEYRYPFYAPPEIHCRINSMFNEKLKEFCIRNGYHYIDMYSRFSDTDGFMLKAYTADEIHLNGRVAYFVKGELESIGLNI